MKKPSKNELKELLQWALKYTTDAKIEKNRVVVDGNFYCCDKNLKSLPDSIGNMEISGNFDCSNNLLTSLPESVGNMRIRSFYCDNNKLTSLPESIGNMKISGDFYCYDNQLTTLPESIGNMRIRGSFYCYNNKLTSLPESIGNMRIGGGFYCYNNQLENKPTIKKLEDGIYLKEGYTYLDGIFTDIVSKKEKDGVTIIKTSFRYVVSNKKFHAHGKDLRNAFLDLHFKSTKRDNDHYRNLDTNQKLDLDELYAIYRNITGACQNGISNWMTNNPKLIKKIEKDGISIKDLIIETNGQYGNDKLQEFFNLT